MAADALLLRQVYVVGIVTFGAIAHKKLALHQMCCDLTTELEVDKNVQPIWRAQNKRRLAH
jgi:uncharacterized OB-fold protein